MLDLAQLDEVVLRELIPFPPHTEWPVQRWRRYRAYLGVPSDEDLVAIWAEEAEHRRWPTPVLKNGDTVDVSLTLKYQ